MPVAQPAPVAHPETLHAAWFSRLRWWAAAGQATVIVLGQLFLPLRLPLVELFAVIGLVLGSNLGLALWRARRPVTERALVALLVIDVLALSSMLYLTGGAANPFSSLYVVYVACAAVVLRAPATWALTGLALGLFGLLFFVSRPLQFSADSNIGHEWHLQGMWISFGLTAVLIVYFVQRLNRALAARDRELRGVREAGIRAERLAALATLSAGAAHELATPLSTIAVVAKELERALVGDPERAAAAEDARLVRQQVQRCRRILDQMSAEAGEVAGETFEAASVQGIVDAALTELSPEARARVDVDVHGGSAEGRVPVQALARAIRNLLDNALDASGDQHRVELAARADAEGMCVRVTDHGSGMPAEVLTRVGEPFFTTKPAGRGMGLGIFLGRTVAERLDGSLAFESSPGEGTVAELRVPLVARPKSVA